MTAATERKIIRWFYIVASIPVVEYVSGLYLKFLKL